MDIMELGAIGELVGGVAVIVSLLYVGTQVRQNTSVARAASHHGIIDSFNQFNLSMARDPVLARIFQEGTDDRAGLSEDDRLQYDWLAFGLFRILETLHYQSHAGFAERQFLHEQERGFAVLLEGAGTQEWWRDNPFVFSSDFSRYVEGLLPDDARRVGA